jgi:FtsH ternary system domain X6
LQMGGQRLADRAATYQAATALLRHMDRLAGWTRWARSCGYFDDGYEAAQLWLADWEQYEGDVLVSRAQTIIRNLDPMRQAAQA